MFRCCRTAARLFTLFSLFALFWTGCVYESEHLNAVKCSTDGERQGDRICQNNLWIHDPHDVGVLADTGHGKDMDAAAPTPDVENQENDTDSDLVDASPTDTAPHDAHEDDAAGDSDAERMDADDESDVEDGDTDESDTSENNDAGGPPWPDGEPCVVNDDCESGVCEIDNGDGVCVAHPCNNGVLDEGEVDIDCGGNCPNACSGYQAIAAGGNHTCALREDNTVMCWGKSEQATIPVELLETEFDSISAGLEHTCGIKSSDQTVACWGKSSDKRLEAGTDAFDTISLGTSHACGVRRNGKLHCWGRNQDDNVKDTPGSNSSNNKWIGVAAGNKQSCAFKEDGAFQCWGKSGSQRIGFNGAERFRAMSAADYHTCGIDSQTRRVVCVGKDDNTISGDSFPSNKTANALAARRSSACMIETDGTFHCWGGFDLDSDLQVNAISLGWEHGCAILAQDKRILCTRNSPGSQYPVEFDMVGE